MFYLCTVSQSSFTSHSESSSFPEVSRLESRWRPSFDTDLIASCQVEVNFRHKWVVFKLVFRKNIIVVHLNERIWNLNLEFPVLVSLSLEEILDGLPLVRQLRLCQLGAEALQHLRNVFDCHRETFNRLKWKQKQKHRNTQLRCVCITCATMLPAGDFWRQQGRSVPRVRKMTQHTYRWNRCVNIYIIRFHIHTAEFLAAALSKAKKKHWLSIRAKISWVSVASVFQESICVRTVRKTIQSLWQ